MPWLDTLDLTAAKSEGTPPDAGPTACVLTVPLNAAHADPPLDQQQPCQTTTPLDGPPRLTLYR